MLNEPNMYMAVMYVLNMTLNQILNKHSLIKCLHFTLEIKILFLIYLDKVCS